MQLKFKSNLLTILTKVPYSVKAASNHHSSTPWENGLKLQYSSALGSPSLKSIYLDKMASNILLFQVCNDNAKVWSLNYTWSKGHKLQYRIQSLIFQIYLAALQQVPNGDISWTDISTSSDLGGCWKHRKTGETLSHFRHQRIKGLHL